MEWNKLSVLVTGGTGSFGKKFVGTMLAEYHPRRVIVFSRDELKQHEMRIGGFDHPSVRYFIGDVRDFGRLRRAFQEVDVVVHAAALKQVPACEYNPIEAVNTNVNGAKNVIDAALDCGTQKVLALSTDKATAPVNLYGATKLVAEKLFVQANAYSGPRKTRFACVRYGNVVGSRGSVVPLFLAQRKNGKITVTDPRMTRFWITLEQGVRFVVSSIEKMHGGEVFIPKLPSMNIMDLAGVLAPQCEVEYIGIRPGEKLHESLLSRYEAPQALEMADRYVIFPAHSWWSQNNYSDGKSLPDGFFYSSDNNGNWLTPEQLSAMVEA
ncbi:MAG TPA: UDP-N-acetylglucosamine 4,6-dehydratase (inverting) [Atribacteraceae bacterium]|nr:UDP-N-acetylglucosamine 4,6-dehydratase (inverting) [Atribacteraceae bacterium]